MSLSDNEAWRRLRLTPLLSSSKFSALKCLQNSSIIQNNSEVSLNEVKNFVTGSHIKYFCNCLTFTCKNTKHLWDYQLFCWLSLITNWGSIWNRVCKYSWKKQKSLLRLAKSLCRRLYFSIDVRLVLAQTGSAPLSLVRRTWFTHRTLTNTAI